MMFFLIIGILVVLFEDIATIMIILHLVKTMRYRRMLRSGMSCDGTVLLTKNQFWKLVAVTVTAHLLWIILSYYSVRILNNPSYMETHFETSFLAAAIIGRNGIASIPISVIGLIALWYHLNQAERTDDNLAAPSLHSDQKYTESHRHYPRFGAFLSFKREPYGPFRETWECRVCGKRLYLSSFTSVFHRLGRTINVVLPCALAFWIQNYFHFETSGQKAIPILILVAAYCLIWLVEKAIAYFCFPFSCVDNTDNSTIEMDSFK